MGRQYITSLSEGEKVDANFALLARELRVARTGDVYLALELADRSGRIAGIMFRPSAESASIPADCVVHVTGMVTSYRGVARVTVERVRRVTRFDSAELMAAGTRDSEELLSQLRSLVRSIRAPALAAIARRVFRDAEFMSRFKTCPASQGYHHAHIGGLLEHTVSVAALCMSLCDLYPLADADLLVTGALLHDIGKVDELAFLTSIKYTDEGRMIGHVVLGERRVREAVEALGGSVPRETAMRLSHILLAHHGELEWGSPKRPSTLEALILHHADNLDAKTSGFLAATAQAGRVDEPWTDAGNLFRRPLWAPRAAEDDRVLTPLEDGQYARTA